MDTLEADRTPVLWALGQAQFNDRGGVLSVDRIERFTGLTAERVQRVLSQLASESRVVGTKSVGYPDFDNAVLCGEGVTEARRLIENMQAVRARAVEAGEEQQVPFRSVDDDEVEVCGVIRCRAISERGVLIWLPEITSATRHRKAISVPTEFGPGGQESLAATAEFLGEAANGLMHRFVGHLS